MLNILRVLESFVSEVPNPELKIADTFPNLELTNQFGEQVRLREDFVNQGTALIINTMYSTCRGSCPGTSAMIESLRKDLSPVFGKRLTFLSFTLEPHVDTPEVLRDYAQMFGAGRPKPKLSDWHFLTAPAETIQILRKTLGFFDLDPNVDQDITQHASLLLVGNPATDRWCMLPAELRKSTLKESIRRLVGVTFEERYGIRETTK